MCQKFYFCKITLFTLLVYSECKGKAFSTGSKDETEMAMDRITKINKGSALHLYEGDILLNKDDIDTVDMSEEGDIDGKNVEEMKKRNADRQREKLWHNRVVPYEIASELTSSAETIESAFDEYHNKTCLKFIPRTTEWHWIRFIRMEGCWSSIGRLYKHTTGQDISLGSGCVEKGVIIHEIMHALGFYHEQSRTDRNEYVEIFWENIEKGESHNFNKYSQNVLDKLGVKYDYESIMHYGSNAFSKNGEVTIRAIRDNIATMGQRYGLSSTDVIKINALYNCHMDGIGWSEWSGFSPCSNECQKERQRYCFSPDLTQCPGISEYGVQSEKAVCSDMECFVPIQGHWGRWSSWSKCDSLCGVGTKTRTRVCDDPPPKNNGNYCAGSSDESLKCIQGSCNLGPDDCEFGAGDFCHWTKSGNSNYAWNIHSGPTPTAGTGPNGDHTTGKGRYIYAESSYPAIPGLKARLTSKVFSKCRCMTWSYHMFGQYMGQLAIYVQRIGHSREVVWSKSGQQGLDWITDEITISTVNGSSYTVQFESTRGQNYLSDIALDDIFFKDQPCGVQALGCYKDQVHKRVLPHLIENLRSEIDWKNIQKTINRCACLAFDQGYKYFSVQFYGECWGSKTEVDYAKHGLGTCSNGVGHHWSNFVYTFTS